MSNFELVSPWMFNLKMPTIIPTKLLQILKVDSPGDWAYLWPWRRKWQPTPVLLPGKSHGQRSLVGYSPLGRRVGHDWATSLALCVWFEWCSSIILADSSSVYNAQLSGGQRLTKTRARWRLLWGGRDVWVATSDTLGHDGFCFPRHHGGSIIKTE